MAEPKQGEGLHHFIATGGNPKDYKGMVDGGVYKSNEEQDNETE